MTLIFEWATIEHMVAGLAIGTVILALLLRPPPNDLLQQSHDTRRRTAKRISKTALRTRSQGLRGFAIFLCMRVGEAPFVA